MSPENESYPSYAESELGKLRRSKEAEGWALVGREKLTKTKLSPEARFEEIPFQTEDSIREHYLKQAREQNPGSDFEVELVLDETTDKLLRIHQLVTEAEYREALTKLRDEDKMYLIFVRKR